jgi:hypothetical protein
MRGLPSKTSDAEGGSGIRIVSNMLETAPDSARGARVMIRDTVRRDEPADPEAYERSPE